MTCIFADPKEWLLEITPTNQSQSWDKSQMYSTVTSRWCAYINQICLHAFLNWIETEYAEEGKVWQSSADVPAFWEFVNGTAILLNGKKVVLIPTEAIDDGELEVPQEWVDIPSWSADFYLGVQVQPDGEYVRFWGYTTHQELKNPAYYDPIDRTYCIDAKHLTKDLNAFWMAYQFCQVEDVKGAVSIRPGLSTNKAENILHRLSDSKAMFPRLEIPFEIWGALLEKEEYRQELYRQRQGLPQKINLSDWLEDIYQGSWQAIDNFLSSNRKNLAFNFRSGSGVSTGTNTTVKRAKLVDLGTQAESQKVVLVLGLTPSVNQQVGIRVQLHPFDDEYLPFNIKLVLLSDSAEMIQEVQSRLQDNYMQLKLFEGEVGECFSIQVIFDSYEITENFMI